MPTIVHLLASTYLGGPERQILGLARQLSPSYRSVLMTFRENGLGSAFVQAAHELSLEAYTLKIDTPWLPQSINEIAEQLRTQEASLVLCHGYKANLLGRQAARRVKIPALAVSRGWTGECIRVKIYEALDRLALPWLDRVICVSQSQAHKVRQAGVKQNRIEVICNAIDPDRFKDKIPSGREVLLKHFSKPVTHVIGAAGRLSPEKGFDILVKAASIALQHNPHLGFILYGDGPCRPALAAQILDSGIQEQFVLGGFNSQLDQMIPNFDAMVLSSHTEGLPNVILEAAAAAVPFISTAVGGTPEIIESGKTGYLVQAGDAKAIADRICQLMASEPLRLQMGQWARERVIKEFGFGQQAEQYTALFKTFGCYPNQEMVQDNKIPDLLFPELACLS